jgi:hypothetical protein
MKCNRTQSIQLLQSVTDHRVTTMKFKKALTLQEKGMNNSNETFLPKTWESCSALSAKLHHNFGYGKASLNRGRNKK